MQAGIGTGGPQDGPQLSAVTGWHSGPQMASGGQSVGIAWTHPGCSWQPPFSHAAFPPSHAQPGVDPQYEASPEVQLDCSRGTHWKNFQFEQSAHMPVGWQLGQHSSSYTGTQRGNAPRHPTSLSVPQAAPVSTGAHPAVPPLPPTALPPEPPTPEPPKPPLPAEAPTPPAAPLPLAPPSLGTGSTDFPPHPERSAVATRNQAVRPKGMGGLCHESPAGHAADLGALNAVGSRRLGPVGVAPPWLRGQRLPKARRLARCSRGIRRCRTAEA